jgi:hypothetical protein
MKTLTPKQWCLAFLVSSLIVGSLWALAMTYFLYLPTFSAVAVHREDRPVISQLYAVATNSFLVALLGGLALGICVPIAYKWSLKRRREFRGEQGGST